MSWAVTYTDQFEAWYLGLSESDLGKILPAIEALEAQGPALPRPRADRIEGSRHHNMKELRSVGGHIRVLFAFDPKRQAILLVGGDKRDRWKRWYAESIGLADQLYDEHLARIRRE